jgi:hypothetical protein
MMSRYTVYNVHATLDYNNLDRLYHTCTLLAKTMTPQTFKEEDGDSDGDTGTYVKRSKAETMAKAGPVGREDEGMSVGGEDEGGSDKMMSASKKRWKQIASGLSGVMVELKEAARKDTAKKGVRFGAAPKKASIAKVEANYDPADKSLKKSRRGSVSFATDRDTTAAVAVESMGTRTLDSSSIPQHLETDEWSLLRGIITTMPFETHVRPPNISPKH